MVSSFSFSCSTRGGRAGFSVSPALLFSRLFCLVSGEIDGIYNGTVRRSGASTAIDCNHL